MARDVPELVGRQKTVGDLLDLYRQHRLPEMAYGEKLGGRLAWWEERLGRETRLAMVTSAKVAEARRELLGGRSGATTNRYLSALAAAFTFAVRELQWPIPNPCRGVARSRESAGRVAWLEAPELAGLLAAVDSDPEPRLGSLVRLALATGMRQSELMGLTWDRVDYDRRRVLLPKTKSGHPRTVPLTAPALAALRALPRRLGAALVFAGEGGTAVYPREAWERARAAAGLPAFRFHDLRHACAVYMVDSGATDLEIAEVLGHRTLAMVKRYSHVRESVARGALERAAKYLEGAEPS
jgi:integrase